MNQSSTRILLLTLALIVTLAYVPTLAAQAKDQPAAAAPKPRASWTSDRKEFVVGDVITVIVDEATLATASKAQSGSDQQSRKNDLGIEPPIVGPAAALPSLDATLKTDKNASSNQTGNAKRDLHFHGEISVRVVAIEKGLLQIKGAKVVDVDKNKQTLNLTGWVRPQDVSLQNAVASDRIADAQVVYALTGDIGKTRGGILGRLINVFWP
jgi:flagellar L-ring protein precursor FlgH